MDISVDHGMISKVHYQARGQEALLVTIVH